MIIRDVRFSIYAKQCSVCVYTCYGIIQIVDILLIKTDWKNNLKLFCKALAHLNGLIFFYCLSILIEIVAALLTEIFALKQLWQENDIGTVCCGFSDHFFCMRKTLFWICAAFHLNCCCFYFTHEFSSLLHKYRVQRPISL